MADVRSQVVDFLRLQLVGPVGGETEVLRDPPDQRYSMGVLYPLGAEQGDVALEQVDDDQAGAYADTIVDDPIAAGKSVDAEFLGRVFLRPGRRGR